MSEVLRTHLSSTAVENSDSTSRVSEVEAQVNIQQNPMSAVSKSPPLTISVLGKRERSESPDHNHTSSSSSENERDDNEPESQGTSANEEHPHKRTKLSLGHQSDGSKLDEVPTNDIPPIPSEKPPSQPSPDQLQSPPPTEPAYRLCLPIAAPPFPQSRYMFCLWLSRKRGRNSSLHLRLHWQRL